MNLSKFLTLLVSLSMAGCGTFGLGIEQLPTPSAALPAPTTTLESATATASPPATATVPPPATATVPPPATVTAPPPATPTPEALPTQVPQNTSAAPQLVKIFLIAVNDHGRSGKQIGCGDSVVPVLVPIPPTLGVLKASLEALLSLKEPYYGQSGLYNALHQSNLYLESVALNGGKAVVRLSGTLKMDGKCDPPRVQAQLVESAMQFSTVNSVSIYLNGRLWSDAVRGSAFPSLPLYP